MTVQPPSGGCVLKPKSSRNTLVVGGPAAFRRLCVETFPLILTHIMLFQPPSGGCVLKLDAV